MNSLDTKSHAVDAGFDPLPAFAKIVGDKYVMTEAEAMRPFLVEPRELFSGRARAVVKPASTREVVEILRLAHQTNTPIVPQGGNTGLVGAQIPMGQGREVILSLQRLDRIREVDLVTESMTVEAGVTLLRAQEAAEGIDRLFPLSLASEGTCTIGGNLSTNAGGTATLAFGNARDLVLGLEVVLADGRVWNGLSKLRKDNTGYDLKHLFMGAEGTLGVITAAVLKLFPRPRSIATTFCGVKGPREGLALLALCRKHAGNAVTTFELIPRFGLDIVLKHGSGTRDPLGAPHPWYVLMEFSLQKEDTAEALVEAALEDALATGLIEDATIATSLDQRHALWKLREALSELQRHEGGSIKHDVSVPVASVPDFIDEASEVVIKAIPGARVLPFGHVGDGNIHFNISQPVGADKEAFLARWSEINEAVHAVALAYGGSISAEHGIGRLKRDKLPQVKDPVAMTLMRALKQTLDPTGILNPGSVL